MYLTLPEMLLHYQLYFNVLYQLFHTLSLRVLGGG